MQPRVARLCELPWESNRRSSEPQRGSAIEANGTTLSGLKAVVADRPRVAPKPATLGYETQPLRGKCSAKLIQSELLRIAFSLLLATSIAGCAQKVPQTEVIGEVTLDGEPVAVAQVYLSPKTAAKKDVGVFSASVLDGAFGILQMEGPPPGEYELYIQPVDEDAEEIAEQLMQKKGQALADREQFRVAVARKGPIRIQLAADEVNEVSIQLTTR